MSEKSSVIFVTYPFTSGEQKWMKQVITAQVPRIGEHIHISDMDGNSVKYEVRTIERRYVDLGRDNRPLNIDNVFVAVSSRVPG